MGIFDGILLCSDIDGTFAIGKQAPKKNMDAVRYFQQEGGLFTFATGRPAGYEQNFDVRCNAPIITENGARIYDTVYGRTLWTFPLDRCERLLEWLEDAPCTEVTLGFTDGYVKTQRKKIIETFLSHKTGELLKLVCHSFPEEAAALSFQNQAQAVFGDRYRIVRSWSTGIEFISPIGGKGACLTHLRAILEDKVHLVVAAGDYENDLSMISAAHCFYAPENAHPQAQRASKTLLPPCEEGAIAALIDLLERKARQNGGI